ncbi:d6ca60dd-a28e-442f-ae7f-57577725cdab [Sclerotinia trifoliorum]|uniref:D6ca60dd-a28e-442f-ae7f-57577725cdab n=1 Tax=Sclerotinia trifoliorum TaxID=28548 RepID=A0A8H2ZQ81_9HELO|nr:d6ca60dd-a28e-442f-ae7f-57577725cdab [Sclerotinia trifoliorum]
MTFTSFYEQPLRQILAEVVEINRRNGVFSRDPVTSAAPKRAFSNAPAKVAQLNTDSTVHKVVDSPLAGFDHVQRQIKAARSAPVWVAPVVIVSAAPSVVEPREAIADQGIELGNAAHFPPLPTRPIRTGLATPVVRSKRSSVDRGLERIKAVHSPPPLVASAKATQAIPVVELQAAAPNKVAPIESVKFAKDGNIKIGADKGLDRIKAACTSFDVPVPPTLSNKACKFFLSRNGCRYEDNCPLFHDYDALNKRREQWVANDAKKLEQVRSDKQPGYTQKALALQSNNARVSMVVTASSKSFLKETVKKRSACNDYRSSRGCHRKHCLFSHESLPSQEPEKLIDDTIPGEVQIPKFPRTMIRKRNASKASKAYKAPVVKFTEPEPEPEPEATLPGLESIVWANNPHLGDEKYCDSAIWKIFGKPCPAKEEAIEWFQEMHSNGNLKHFTFGDIIRWARSMCISDRDEFLTHIGYMPGILESFEPRVQLYIERLRAKYDAEKARPKYDTFHCFDKLPNELCMKIWGFAARAGRTLTASINKKQIYTSDGPGLFIRHLGSGGSPLWYVNKQSQKASMMDKHCGYYFGCDYFSPSFDTLFLNDSAESLNSFTSQIVLWRGNVVQRLSFPHYQLCNVTCLRRFAADLLKAFPGLIRIEFWLSDGEYYSKYLKKSASIIEKANAAIVQAYGVRVGVKPPRVRFVMVPEKRALEIGIGGGLW